MRTRRSHLSFAALTAATLVVGALVVAGCHSSSEAQVRVVSNGSADAGKRAIKHFGCGSCHEIPGIKGARGLVGPPLIKFSRRGYIAGELRNTANNLTRWIQDPKGVEPGTDMPDLGVSEQEARDITAYLYTLR